MAFISYAQNLEDVMLHRALRGVSRGFYIDVGAADPDELSVTRAFYDAGWHGINVEPDPDYAGELRSARARDVTVQAALGTKPGRRVINRILSTGLSTFDAEFAARHVAAGYPSVPLEVDVTTLAEVWRAHAPVDVHFLKIDVEGAERDVLQGADFSLHRPWIVVVEATEPFLPTPNYEAWEGILLNAGYVFVWFDGLNRFYVEKEHEKVLRPAFQVPPNFFDDFQRSEEIALRARVRDIEARHVAATAHASEANERAGAAETRAEAAETRAEAAETRAEAAETRAGAAETRAGAAETRASEMETLSREAQARAGAAETRAEAAETRAEAAETRAEAAETRAEAAETRAGAAETRAGRRRPVRGRRRPVRGRRRPVRGRRRPVRGRRRPAPARWRPSRVRRRLVRGQRRPAPPNLRLKRARRWHARRTLARAPTRQKRRRRKRFR